MSSQANIRNTFFDQRSPRHQEVGVLRRHIHTDGHCDSMTDPAQRAKSEKVPYHRFLDNPFGMETYHWSSVCVHLSGSSCTFIQLFMSIIEHRYVYSYLAVILHLNSCFCPQLIIFMCGVIWQFWYIYTVVYVHN